MSENNSKTTMIMFMPFISAGLFIYSSNQLFKANNIKYSTKSSGVNLFLLGAHGFILGASITTTFISMCDFIKRDFMI